MDPLTVLLILLVACVACAVAGASVAKEKGREPLEGAIYGAEFGPLGIVITALLPTKQGQRGHPQVFVGYWTHDSMLGTFDHYGRKPGRD